MRDSKAKTLLKFDKYYISLLSNVIFYLQLSQKVKLLYVLSAVLVFALKETLLGAQKVFRTEHFV